MRYNSSHTYRELSCNNKISNTIDTANCHTIQIINLTGLI